MVAPLCVLRYMTRNGVYRVSTTSTYSSYDAQTQKHDARVLSSAKFAGRGNAARFLKLLFPPRAWCCVVFPFCGATKQEDDIREGETAEEALQRRIEEGKIGKGKTLRRWKDTEEKVM